MLVVKDRNRESPVPNQSPAKWEEKSQSLSTTCVSQIYRLKQSLRTTHPVTWRHRVNCLRATAQHCQFRYSIFSNHPLSVVSERLESTTFGTSVRFTALLRLSDLNRYFALRLVT